MANQQLISIHLTSFLCIFIVTHSAATIDVTSHYGGIIQTADHTWSVGVPEIDVTFSGLSAEIWVLRERNSSNIVVSTCTVLADSGNCDNSTSACSCRNVSADSYEATYHLSLDVSKNESSITLDNGGSTPIVLATATIILTTCPDVENAIATNSGGCIFNHFDCPALFSCSKSYTGDNVYLTCMANATWNDTIHCTDETTTPITTAAAVNSTSVECQCTVNSAEQCTNCCLDSVALEPESVVSCGKSLSCCDNFVNTTSIEQIRCTDGEFQENLICKSVDSGLSCGDIAGIVFTVAFVIVCVIAGVAIICLEKPLSNIVKGFYAACIILCVAGILMCFLGTGPPVSGSLNGVEIAGIVIATIGIVLGIVGLALHFRGEKMTK